MTAAAQVEFEITTREDAKVFAAAAIAIIEDLRDLLSEETALLRNAKFRAASELSARKAGLVGSYARYMTTIKTSRERLDTVAPDVMSQLIVVHDSLSEAASENLPVVERARDTTYRVVMGINTLVKKETGGPTTYGPGAIEQQAQPVRSSALSLDRAI